jgi:hypothetical protein
MDKETSTAAKSMSVKLAAVTVVITGFVRAWGRINRVIEETGKAYQTQIQAEQRLTHAVRATGEALGLSTEALMEQASALSRVTQFGDEAIIGAQAVLAQFGRLGADTMPRATRATLDLAAALGTDAATAARQLGRALSDTDRASVSLRSANVILTESQREAIKSFNESGDELAAMGVILDQLERQFGGFAEAMGQTSAGVAARFANLKSDLAEAVGEILTALRTNFLRALIPIMEEVIAWINRNAPKFYAWIVGLPEIAQIAFRTVQEMLQRTFEWDTLSAVMSQLMYGIVGAFEIAIKGVWYLWDRLFTGIFAAAGTLGENWALRLIDGIVAGMTTGGPVGQWILGQMGIEWKGWRPFGTESVFGEAMTAIGGQAVQAYRQFLGFHIDSHAENLRRTFAPLADRYADIFEKGASQIGEVVDRHAQAFEEFRQAELAAASAGDINIDFDIPDIEIPGLRDDSLRRARELADLVKYGAEFVALNKQYENLMGAVFALDKTGDDDLKVLADMLRDEQSDVLRQIFEIMLDPHGEKAKRQVEIQNALNLSELVRYGAEYVRLQNEQLGIQAALEILSEQHHAEQIDVLHERLGAIALAMEDIRNPPPGQEEPPEILTFMDALGGLEGVIDHVAEGIGGNAEMIIRSVAQFGWLGLAIAALTFVVDGLLSTIGPIINRILDPLINFLGLLGQIIGTLLIPVFNALSPLLMMAVQVLSSLLPLFQLLEITFIPIILILQFLTPRFTALAVAIEVLMSPIRFIADMFTWATNKIRYSVVEMAAWLTHPFNENRRQAYIKSQGVSDPGKFTSDAFTGLRSASLKSSR